MRHPKFIYIPCVSIPSLITPTTPHTLTVWHFLRSMSSLYVIPDFTRSGRLISRISVTKPACSRLRITVCLLATRELEHKPRDLYPPAELYRSFHYRPNSQLTGWNFTNWYVNASWRTRSTLNLKSRELAFRIFNNFFRVYLCNSVPIIRVLL